MLRVLPSEGEAFTLGVSGILFEHMLVLSEKASPK